MDKTQRAKLLLIELDAIREGDYTARTQDLLVLINEALKDAKVLAQEVLKEDKAA